MKAYTLQELNNPEILEQAANEFANLSESDDSGSTNSGSLDFDTFILSSKDEEITKTEMDLITLI